MFEQMILPAVTLDGDTIHTDVATVMSVSDAIKMSERISTWYRHAYPDDVLGKEISSDVTFQRLYNAILDGVDVYDVIGVGDSIIRGRCFEHLSDITGLSYDEIYDKWLEN